ncbi:hypothetical protein C1H46_031553 [Malus baccata]|uniref:Trafficking protein particle complex subunit n=1 Tax=Malus baccata TaxID=106549 RepID=A0A540L9A0_MALBA|nr:hypothetical protein C1H46_031553 [Malus baccata]
MLQIYAQTTSNPSSEHMGLLVSLSAFAFLFSELVQYNQTQVDNIAELERRLEDAGYAVGARVLELLCHRDKGNRRETRLLGILSFVHSTVWKVLFGKVADSLEKGTEHEDEYMISEKELLVNRFISIPKDMGTFNCGAFVAGIVRGVLDGAGFPAVVTAHFVPVEGQQRPRTTILIKFAEEVTDYLFVLHYVRSDVPILSSYSNLVVFFPLQVVLRNTAKKVETSRWIIKLVRFSPLNLSVVLVAIQLL